MVEKLNIEIDYDLESKELPEDYYPDPGNDWSVIIRIPAKPDWRDTQLFAEGVGKIVKKALEVDTNRWTLFSDKEFENITDTIKSLNDEGGPSSIWRNEEFLNDIRLEYKRRFGKELVSNYDGSKI